MENPTWADLQKLGCSEIGTVKRFAFYGTPILNAPTCKKCGQKYYYSYVSDEWIHPFEKEFNEFRNKQHHEHTTHNP